MMEFLNFQIIFTNENKSIQWFCIYDTVFNTI